MAAIDKIYANKENAKIILDFLNEHRDEIIARCGIDPIKYTYSQDWSNWKEYDEKYNPGAEHPVTNFPEGVDVCLAQMDNLPKPLIDGLLWCYSEEWLNEMRDARGKGGKYDFEPWKYEVADRFVLDFSGYKFDDKNNNKLNLGRGWLYVSAKYLGNGSKYEDGTSLWFVEDTTSHGPKGWYCDEFDLRIPDAYWSTSEAALNIKTIKSLIRWARKMKFPKGTTLLCDTGWVGGDFKLHCK